MCVRSSRRDGLRFKRLVAGGLALFLFSCSSVPVYADELDHELYDEYGFANQIDTYKVLPVASASNAVSTLEGNGDIAVQSSAAVITNRVDWSGASVRLFSGNTKVGVAYISVGGTFSYRVPSGKSVNKMDVYLHTSALPAMGSYRFNIDFASDTDLNYNGNAPKSGWFYISPKSQPEVSKNFVFQGFQKNGSDVFAYSNMVIQSSVNAFAFQYQFSDVSANGVIGGRFSANFDSSTYSSSSTTTSPGTAPSTSDIQSNISSTTTQISSRVNDVYDSIIALAQTISNQLAALWDQMYNYMHVPTYNKLQEILLSIKNISMGSDLQKIADQISNTTMEQTSDLIANEDARTDDIINNQNSNQQKTEAAIQKHGNFIIEGLKSLFIPSDEFFKSWFDDMYNFFYDRLGFLMLPIDILIKFIKMFQSAGSNFSGIPFPEFKWIDGTVIIPAQSVQFEFLSTSWGKDIQTKLYFVGNVIMIGALLAFMHRKLEEVLGN